MNAIEYGYEALHTVDESGARIERLEGAYLGAFSSVAEALSALIGYAGGYVRRSDGAELAPDGTWIERT